MTPAEQHRAALLGPAALAAIDKRVQAAPEPEPGEWVDQLRRIFASPPAPIAAPHATASAA